MPRSRFEWALGGQFLLQHTENTITGAWEKGPGDAGWEHDFALTFRRGG